MSFYYINAAAYSMVDFPPPSKNQGPLPPKTQAPPTYKNLQDPPPSDNQG